MKIVFFGVGAVCSVIARLLYDLSKKSSNDEIKFLFVVRDIKKAKSHFFKNTEVLNNSEFFQQHQRRKFSYHLTIKSTYYFR